MGKEKNENPNKLTKLLDVLNLEGFINHNFGKDTQVKKPIKLTSQSIPHSTKARLRRIQIDLDWTNSMVVKELNMPKHKKLEYTSYNAIYFKYVYSYYVEYKTDLFDYTKDISNEDIIKPVDNPRLFATLLL